MGLFTLAAVAIFTNRNLAGKDADFVISSSTWRLYCICLIFLSLSLRPLRLR